MKELFLILQIDIMREFLNGEFTTENRADTDFYRSRFCNINKRTGEILSFKKYDTVIFQAGYHKGAKRIKVEIKDIYFEGHFLIELGKLLDSNFDVQQFLKTKPKPLAKPKAPKLEFVQYTEQKTPLDQSFSYYGLNHLLR